MSTNLASAMALAAHLGLARPMASIGHFGGEPVGRAAIVSCRFPWMIQMQHLLIIFVTVFLAELGDKTQFATLLFSADGRHHPMFVFVAAALALVVSTAIAVALGTMAERYLTIVPLRLIAGAGFVGIGIWTIWGHFQPT